MSFSWAKLFELFSCWPSDRQSGRPPTGEGEEGGRVVVRDPEPNLWLSKLWLMLSPPSPSKVMLGRGCDARGGGCVERPRFRVRMCPTVLCTGRRAPGRDPCPRFPPGPSVREGPAELSCQTNSPPAYWDNPPPTVISHEPPPLTGRGCEGGGDRLPSQPPFPHTVRRAPGRDAVPTVDLEGNRLNLFGDMISLGPPIGRGAAEGCL